MPFSNIHKVRKGKNLALLAVLLFLAVAFFCISMIRTGQAVRQDGNWQTEQ